MIDPAAQITKKEFEEIAEILKRRANEIANYHADHRDIPGSVELALFREMDRLRDLAQRVCPPKPQSCDD